MSDDCSQLEMASGDITTFQHSASGSESLNSIADANNVDVVILERISAHNLNILIGLWDIKEYKDHSEQELYGVNLPQGSRVDIPIIDPNICLALVNGKVTPFYKEIPEEVVFTDVSYRDDVPPVYGMDGTQDFLLYLWVARWQRSVDSFDYAVAEELFRQDLLTLGHDTDGIADGTISIEDLIQLYDIYDESKPSLYDYEEWEQEIIAYQYLMALDNDEAYPFDPYVDYQDDLAMQFWYETNFGDVENDEDIERVKDVLSGHIAGLIVYISSHNEEREYTFYDTSFFNGDCSNNDIFDIVADWSVNEIIVALEQVESDIRTLLDTPDDMFDNAIGNVLVLDAEALTQSYREMEGYDTLRSIVYDPNWDHIAEKQELDQLADAIGQMAREILGVDVGFVQDAFTDYHKNLLDLYELRIKLKADVDQFELDALEVVNQSDWDRLWSSFKDALLTTITVVSLGSIVLALAGYGLPLWVGSVFDAVEFILTGNPITLIGFMGDAARVTDDTSGFFRNYTSRGNLWSVDPNFIVDDIKNGVRSASGYYDLNTSRRLINSDAVNPQSGNILGVGGDRLMYVVDGSGNIWIGKRAHRRMPHPTLIGGRDPRVLAAGMVQFRKGRIVWIDNASGHFKPQPTSLALRNARDAFERLPDTVFDSRFVGYLDYLEREIRFGK